MYSFPSLSDRAPADRPSDPRTTRAWRRRYHLAALRLEAVARLEYEEVVRLSLSPDRSAMGRHILIAREAWRLADELREAAGGGEVA